MNNLGQTLMAQGELSDARALHERAFEGYRRVLGEDHRETITSLHNLAATVHTQGDLS